MTKHSEDTIAQIVDEIISEMPLEERVSLANIDEEDADALQGVFDLYMQSKVDPDDEDYKNIIHELLKKLKKTHRLRVVK